MRYIFSAPNSGVIAFCFVMGKWRNLCQNSQEVEKNRDKLDKNIDFLWK